MPESNGGKDEPYRTRLRRVTQTVLIAFYENDIAFEFRQLNKDHSEVMGEFEDLSP